ncbi:Clavaminate synthase-like protein [Imleria badia]|nr:Clavaminate synthase-like protein [Imleria badia]
MVSAASDNESHRVDYVDLPIIDLANFQSAGNRTLLATQVRDALLTHGFFHIVGHGYRQSETDIIFDIADIPFTGVSDEEKQAYSGIMKQTGSFQGYKPRGYFHINNGVHDHRELHHQPRKRGHPEALRLFLPEIKEFCKFNHFNVLHPILQLIALSLELPEDALVNIHDHDAKCYPRSDDEEDKTNNVWLQGHTDTGSVNILWSQPVAGLQILSKDGQWRWVKHIDNALVGIHSADLSGILLTVCQYTGGECRGCIGLPLRRVLAIHRVVQPPPDQQHYTSLEVFYVGSLDDHTKLIPLRESPLLQRVGINPRCEDSVAPTMGHWTKGRTSAYGKSDLMQGQEKGVEEEIIHGIVVKHWN